MDRPSIGICSALERVRFNEGVHVAATVPLSLTGAVTEAGGVPLVLAPDDELAQSPDAMLDRVEALLLTGGPDVDPASYGATPVDPEAETWPERDRHELGLVHRALERDLPVLGLARGMQMLNVALGGTLDQAITGHAGTKHEVRLEPGSLAARACGDAERVTVTSGHHQAPAELGEGLSVTGRSEPDGVIEAIESSEHQFALGLLWAPGDSGPVRLVMEALSRRAHTT